MDYNLFIGYYCYIIVSGILPDANSFSMFYLVFVTHEMGALHLVWSHVMSTTSIML
jgi:hypothetical protein